jgi:hypothetical protein
VKLDLTPQIKLEKKDQEKYERGRFVVLAGFLFLAVFLFSQIFFPSAYFSFSFSDPESSKNTIDIPREQSGQAITNGTLKEDSPIIFDAVKAGNYSSAKMNISLEKNSEVPEKSEVILRKSFQSFLYPDGGSLGFKDGTLLISNGKYFLVSDGLLRPFESLNTAENLGFKKKSFLEVDEKDLTYNSIGNPIEGRTYPDGSIFKIKETYYILENGKLREFVSPQAYLTRFSDDQSIPQEEAFLKNYEVFPEKTGFADGTLVSYGISASIISKNTILPINNPETFESAGYDWNDIIPISGDEYSLYEKGKLFNISSPHPDGTIFETIEDSEFFLIKDGQKYALPTKSIVSNYLKKNPIKVSGKSLETFAKCELKKSPFGSGKYSCDFPLENLSGFAGKDYEFQMSSGNEIEASNLKITLSKTVSFSNFKIALRELLNKVILTYASKI